MSRFKLQLLGTVHVESDEGDSPRFRSQRTVALLGYLVAEQRAISRDYLATLFWPDKSLTTGKANLRRELHNLAQILPNCWQTSRVEVEFVPSPNTTVDIYQLQKYETSQQWTEAKTLIGGNFLEGVTLADNLEFETWLLGEQERWRQGSNSVLSRMRAQNIARGHYDTAIENGRYLLQLTPWDEEAHQQLILLLAWTGKRTEALQQFAICCQQLTEHLAIEPDAATQTLYQTILETKEAADLKALLAAKLARLQPPHNLPQSVTRLIGRSDALAALQVRLAQPDSRLLTLIGPGGIGKTRLAIETAYLTLANYQHGAFFVDLAPLEDPTLVANKISEALQLKLRSNESVLKQLQAFLQDKQLLLILDNFEHLLTASPVVSMLLQSAPKLTVLATSRVLLRLSGERAFQVDPLIELVAGKRPLPPQLMTNEAVCLFTERAQAVKPDFELTVENVTAVADICLRLDGLPLAIELVAARSRLLSPAQILAHWSQGVHLYSQGARDLPERQQTLQATLAWSCALLTAEEQTLLEQLAVFVGSFTLDAAEAACSLSSNSSILVGLESLLNNSLLRDVRQRDEPRFRMLVTIREYGLNLLKQRGAEQKIRQRHAHYFMGLAERARSFYNSKQQVLWLSKIESVQDDVRAALAWSYENELEIHLRLVSALGKFWHMRVHHQEGSYWLQQVLKRDDTNNYPNLRGKALYESGRVAFFQSESQAAVANLAQSVNLLRQLNDKEALAPALRELAAAFALQDNLPQARTYVEESMDLFAQLEDTQGLAQAFFWHGHITYMQKDYVTAQTSAKRCIQLALRVEDIINVSAATSTLGRIALQQTRLKDAEAYFEGAIRFGYQTGDRVIIGIGRGLQGELAYLQKTYEQAIDYYEEALEISQKANDKLRFAYQNYMLGMAYLQQSDLVTAKQYLAESLRQFYQLDKDQGEQKVICSLMGLTAVAQAAHQPEKAAKLIGTIEALLETANLTLAAFFATEYEFEPMGAAMHAEYKQAVATTQASLTAERFSALRTLGRHHSFAHIFSSLSRAMSLRRP